MNTENEAGKTSKKNIFLRNLPDLFILIGFTAALYGIYCIYIPLMWIAGGLGFIFIGYPRKEAN